jgi:hypothetical protein
VARKSHFHFYWELILDLFRLKDMKNHLWVGFLLLLMFLVGCSPIDPVATRGTGATPTLVPSTAIATPFSRLDFTIQPSVTPLPFLQMPHGQLGGSLAITRQFLHSARIEWRGNPPHPTLVAQGMLKSSCQQLRIIILPPDEDENILVAASAGIGLATDCTEGDYSVEKEVEIGPYPPGTYTVWLNGENLGEIIFP